MARKLSPLVASVVLDINQWSAGVKQMQRDQKALADSLKPVSQSITDIGRFASSAGKTLAAVGTVIGGSMLAMAKSAANLGDELLDASKRTGIATERLSAYKLLADQSGTSFGALSGGLAKLAKNIFDAANGSKEQARVFQAMGIAVKDANGHVRNASEIFPQIVAVLSKMSDGTEKAALAQKLMGKSAAELIPLINEGTAGISRAQETTEKFGTALSRAQAEMGDRFNDNLAEMKNALQGLAVSIGSILLPALNQLVVKVNDWIAGISRAAREHEGLVKAVGAFAAILTGAGGVLIGVGLFAGQITNLITLFAKLEPLIKASTAATLAYNAALLATPWVAAIAGGLALGVGLVKLSDSIEQAAVAQRLATRDSKEQLAIMDQMIKRRHQEADAARDQAAAIDMLMGRGNKPIHIQTDEEVEAEKKRKELIKKGAYEVAKVKAELLAEELKKYRQTLEDEISAEENRYQVSFKLLTEDLNRKLNLFKAQDLARQELEKAAKEESEFTKETNKELDRRSEILIQKTKERVKANQDAADQVYDIEQTLAKKTKKLAEETRKVWTTAAGNITSDFAKALADVIFEGRKFGDAMKDIAKNTAKSMFEAFLTGLLAPLTRKLAELGGKLASVIFGGGGGAGGGSGIGGAIGGVAGAGGGILGGIFGKSGTAAVGAGGISLASAALSGGIAGGIPLLANLIGGIGGGRKAANEIVKAQEALVAAVTQVLQDQELSALNKSKITENLFSGFAANATAFAQGGGNNAKAANQSFATLAPWMANVRTSLEKGIAAEGLTASSGGPQTVNNYAFTINLSESKNARATGVLFTSEILPAIIDAIKNNTSGVTQVVTSAVKNSTQGVVTTH